MSELGAIEELCDEWTEGAAPGGDAVAAVTFVLRSWEATAAQAEGLREALREVRRRAHMARTSPPALKQHLMDALTRIVEEADEALAAAPLTPKEDN